MRYIIQRFHAIAFALSIICLAVPVLAQSDRMKRDIGDSFSKFDVVRVDATAGGRTLRFNASGRDFEIALTPHEMRAPNFRAENTSVRGNTSVARQPVNTFIGTVNGNARSESRINILGQKIEGFFAANGDRYFIEPAAHYSSAAAADEYVVYRLEDSIRSDTFSCGSYLAEKIENGKALLNTSSPASSSALKHIELATDADLEYVNTLDGVDQANNEILGILNTIEGLYASQLALSISVVFQHTWTTADPFAGANSEAVVRNFQSFWNVNYPPTTTPRDAAHLFSGKANVLSQGWAFLGVLCNNPNFAYGMSGYIDWAPGKYLITAHEIAHNLGANHVDSGQSCENTLMNGQLSGSTPLSFCQYSRGEISTFVATSGSCLTSLSACKFDFDGDSKADLSIYRPLQGEWWYLKSGTGGNGAAQFGQSSDKITPGDYTGDGKADIAFWRPSTGFWFVLRSEDSSFFSFPFGTTNDIPVPADYDADGKADAAVFRPSTVTWFISRSMGGTDIITFGAVGDLPVTADYDGDGRSDIGIFRPGLAEWWIERSTAGLIAFQFGQTGDKAVPGDYTGDGMADVAFWRPSTGFWFILRSEDSSFFSFPFGGSTDIPVPGDYDGDGRFDAGVFRPSETNWYIQRSTAGTLIQQFGAAGDTPVPNAFVR